MGMTYASAVLSVLYIPAEQSGWPVASIAWSDSWEDKGIWYLLPKSFNKCKMSNVYFSDLLINYMHPSLWFLFCSLFHPELDHLPNSPVLSAKPQTAHSPENSPAQHNTYHTSAHSKSTIEPTLTQHNQAVLP